MVTLEKSLGLAMSGVGYTEGDIVSIKTQESEAIILSDLIRNLPSANIASWWIISFIDGRFMRVTKTDSNTIGRTLPR